MKRKKVPVRQERQEDPPPVLHVVRDILSGALPPSGITAETRRGCVELMVADGRTTEEIAAALRVSDRTVRRDREAIRASHAIDPDPEFVRGMVGELVQQAYLAIARIRQVSRPSTASTTEIIQGEARCWRIAKELVESLQRLGYLPMAPVTLKADVRQSVTAEVLDWQGILGEIVRLERIHSASNPSNPALLELARLKDSAAKLALVERVDAVKDQLKEAKDESQAKS